MSKRRIMRVLVLSMLVMGLAAVSGRIPAALTGSVVMAADTADARDANVVINANSSDHNMTRLAGWWGVKKPKIPKGKGTSCVRDTPFMRRNHMDMLLHQRDETMRRGIRTKKYSLNECITCHAVDGADGKPVTVKSPEHFCRVCHDFVAVKVDCFECHASRPLESTSKAAFAPGKVLPSGHRPLAQIRLADKTRDTSSPNAVSPAAQNDLSRLSNFLRRSRK